MGRYYSLNDHMQKKYGEKVYKLALDSGLTCPNRDGTIEVGGCIFCADGGGGYFAKNNLEEAKAFLRNQKEEAEPGAGEMSNMQYYSDTRISSDDSSGEIDKSENDMHFTMDIKEDYEPLSDESHEFYISPETEKSNETSNISKDGAAYYGKGWERQTKSVGDKFIAYYQTYCNTYAPVDELREIFKPALEDDEILEIAIATRPDCLADDVLDLLSEMNSVKPVWVELGLQTIHEKTADYIKRGYPLSSFTNAVKSLREKNIDVIVHLIMGLPGETFNDMLESVKFVNNLDIQGIKFHMLTVLEGTELGRRYQDAMDKLPKENGMMEFDTKLTFDDGMTYEFISLDKYADLICACIASIRPEIVIHRLTGDAPKSILLSPKWTGDKKKVLNTINLHLERLNITQGCLIKAET